MRGRETTSWRALLAEDDDDLRAALGEFLATEGFSILEADTGLRALEILRREAPHLTLSILDVDMPGMTGFEVVQMVRREVILPPTIFLTGRDAEQRRAVAEALGGFPLLHKPIEPAQLRTSLQELLGPPPPAGLAGGDGGGPDGERP